MLYFINSCSCFYMKYLSGFPDLFGQAGTWNLSSDNPGLCPPSLPHCRLCLSVSASTFIQWPYLPEHIPSCQGWYSVTGLAQNFHSSLRTPPARVVAHILIAHALLLPTTFEAILEHALSHRDHFQDVGPLGCRLSVPWP